MAAEGIAIAVDTKDVTATLGSASEALTTRDIECSSVALFPASGNTGNVAIVDNGDPSKTHIIPVEGRVVPISNPASIQVAASVSGDDIDWFAV